MITEWVKEVARTPVLVKLTPNITDIRAVARAAKRGGADGLSAINTINSITGIDLDTLTPRPDVGGYSSHGGYCGPAVKPIALHLVQQIASDPEVGLPISGIGGIAGWREAAEFILLGCGTVQVCTAAMHYGYRIVEDMIDGLSNWMDEKGFRHPRRFPRPLAAASHRVEAPGFELPASWRASIRRSASAATSATSPAGMARTSASIATATPSRKRRRPPRRARIAVTPIAKLDSHAGPRRQNAAGAHSARGRGRMRGLQPVLAGVPGGGLHHHGKGRNRQAVRSPGSSARLRHRTHGGYS